MRIERATSAVVAVGLLFGSFGVTTAQEDSAPAGIEGFRTREVEPGVLRVLDDNAGHDLTKKWPTKRRDVDHIAVGPDGQVWLSITASGEDNERLDGARIWPLGQPTTYGPKDGLGKNHARISVDAQGRLWVFGNRVAVFDGDQWSSSMASRELVAPDGTIWLAGNGVGVESWDSSELTRHLDGTWTDTLFATPDGTIGVNAWDGVHLYDGTAWKLLGRSDQRRSVSIDGTLAVVGDRGEGLRLHRAGASTTVLEDSQLNGVASAPDGSLWVIGAAGKSRGGVYRVDPAAVFDAQAETASEAERSSAEESETEATKPGSTEDESTE